MGAGYRVVIAGALAALLFTAFGLGWISNTVLKNPDQERYQSYRYAADKPLEIDSAAATRAIAQAFQNRAPCDNPKGRDESDLCAQWKAANAAENSALWAQWGFWIAVIGSSLLLWQIILTRRAVEETGEATEAMRAANEIATQAQRPWVEIDVIVHHFTNAEKHISFEYSVQLKNIGKSVAESIWLHTTVVSGWDDFNRKLHRWREGHWKKTQGPSPFALMPGEVFSIPGSQMMSKELKWAGDGAGPLGRVIKLGVAVSAFYNVPGKPSWADRHRTDRAFLFGLSQKERLSERLIFEKDLRSAKGADVKVEKTRTAITT